MATALIFGVFLFVNFGSSTACVRYFELNRNCHRNWLLQEGFDIRTNVIRNCGDGNQIIKVLPNSSIYVNQKCEVISNICTDVKPFSRASVSTEFCRLVEYHELCLLLGHVESPEEHVNNVEQNTSSMWHKKTERDNFSDSGDFRNQRVFNAHSKDILFVEENYWLDNFQGVHCDHNELVMKFVSSVKTLHLLGQGVYKLHEDFKHDTVKFFKFSSKVFNFKWFFMFQGLSCLEAELEFKKN